MESFTLESTITLSNEVVIPRFGLGVWKAEDGEEVKQAVLAAIDAGYRLIDTAKIYGNERGVGEAIAASTVPREKLFITTKLWNTDQGYETALAAIDGSLERLGLSYVDLYLVHWPNEEDAEVRKDSWRAMEEILQRGKAKAIGVSNYRIEHLEEMKAYATVMPCVNQIKLHPFWYQKELADYCEEHTIAVEAYSPLAHAEKLSDPRILAVAERYGKTAAQVLIRWSLQHGWIVIPKSVHKERIIENKEIYDFELKEEDMEALNALDESGSAI